MVGPRASNADGGASVDSVRGSCRRCGGALPIQSLFCPFCATPTGDVPTPATSRTTEVPLVGPPQWTEGGVSGTAIARWDKPSWRRVPGGLAGAVIVVAIALLVTAALRNDDGREVDAAVVVAAASEAGSAPWDLVGKATTLEQLRRAGEAVPAAVGSVKSQLLEVDRVGDDATRRGVRSFLEAEIALLETVARLATLDGDQSDRWPAVAVAGREALRRVTAAAAVLPERIGTNAAAIVAEASSALPALEEALTAMSDRLSTWRAEVDGTRQARDSGRAALDAYAGPFRAQMERYGTLRGEVADYVAKMATTSFREDYDFFERARTRRHEVREAMSGFTAPEGVAASHARVNAVVDRSVGALDAAVAGLNESLANDVAYTMTEGWLRFEAESEDISDAWRAAVAAWDKAVADERARLDAIHDPPRPSV